VLDSGAFTAWKGGSPIDLDDYCRFIEGLAFPPWRYFALDVIGDPVASMRNYETMRARGFNPMPVFTRGEDPAILDTYYETSDVVGIGGLANTEGNRAFVNGIMPHVAGRRVHTLGFAHREYLRAYRPYMADSSTWVNPLRFGLVDLHRDGQVISIKKADFIRPPKPEVAAFVREFGIRPRDLARKEQWTNSGVGRNAVELMTFRSTVRLQLDVQRALGTLLFMPCTVRQHIVQAHAAFRWWRETHPHLFAPATAPNP
jgi:hypothetical protein